MAMRSEAVRPARVEDAPVMAEIKNAWIDGEEWMPRVHSPEDVERHYREYVIPFRDVWVAGDPAHGFVALDPDRNEVTSLFVRPTGQGIGKALLDHVKAGRDILELWSFCANTRARRFYAREEFIEVRETAGDNEEGLPDVLMRWQRS